MLSMSAELPPSSSTQLLDLPAGCMAHVYDALHIRDRVRLNAALPKDRRVTATTRTDRAKDGKLALVYRTMKRRGMCVVKPKMLRFLSENRGDPTVDALAAEHVRLFPCTRTSLSMLGAIEDIRLRITGAAAGRPLVTPEELRDSRVDLKLVATWVMTSASPEQFDALVADDQVACQLRNGSSSADHMLFMATNFGNRPLLEHLVAHSEARHGMSIATAVDDMLHRCSGCLALRKDMRDLLLRCVPLSTEQREVLRGMVEDDLDVASAQEFFA
jgi:hypothetical protein